MPQLQVRFAEDFDRDARPTLPPGSDQRLSWRLADFYRNWFIEAVLKPRKSAAGTFDRYEEMLRYWAAITGDPQLFELEDKITLGFVNELPAWGYSRRGVKKGMKVPIGPRAEHPGFSPLSSATIAEHVSRLATLLRHAGPRVDLRSPTAEILPRFAFVPLVPSDAKEKPPFTLDDARRIAAAAALMQRPATWIEPQLWWETRIALFYFTGLRAGTIVKLAWQFVETRAGQLWLSVPGSIVKTGKDIEMPLHAQLAELLVRVKSALGARSPGLILEPCCGYRQFLDWHSDLQTRAGLPPERQQSPHAWRRTHSVQMALLGARRGLTIASEALDHDDERTTAESYLHSALVDQLRLQLPPLWRIQGLLFQ
ncbi:MAG: site-specific integrase [Planctomycetaceae bacterium]|nr:site-specific integrase [Planctomycetaceae bacterium]